MEVLQKHSGDPVAPLIGMLAGYLTSDLACSLFTCLVFGGWINILRDGEVVNLCEAGVDHEVEDTYAITEKFSTDLTLLPHALETFDQS